MNHYDLLLYWKKRRNFFRVRPYVTNIGKNQCLIFGETRYIRINSFSYIYNAELFDCE